MDIVGQNNKNRKIQKAILLTVMVIVAVIQLFPLIWLADYSFAKSTDLFGKKLLIWNDPPQWNNYVRAFIDGNILKYLRNSIFINVVTVLGTVFIATLVSYACVRMRWKSSRLVMNILLLGMMIPIHATLLPNFMLYTNLKMTDSAFALIIPYIAFALPQGIFIMSGFMESIPRALEEAAVIDGCGVYGIIFRIVFPLLKPAMVTIGIMTFLNSWNEFIMATTFLTSDTWKTLPFSIIQFTGQYQSDYAIQFAVMVLTALPALIIYIFLNEQITKGIMIGAVKG